MKILIVITIGLVLGGFMVNHIEDKSIEYYIDENKDEESN